MVDDSPTLARFVLGDMLRRLRLRSRLTLQDAADEVGVVATTVGRWEAGAVAPKKAPVIVLARRYGATADDLTKMQNWAVKANRRGMFEGSDVPVQLRMLYEAEHAATLIRGVELEHVPGLLQTPEYLAEIQKALTSLYGEAHLEKIRVLRERRHSARSARSRSTRMQYALGPAALAYLDVMPSEVKEGQLNRLLEAVGEGVDIRVITKPHAAMLNAFTLITISENLPPFVYVESLDAGRYLEGEAVLSIHESVFAAVFAAAIPLEEYLNGRQVAQIQSQRRRERQLRRGASQPGRS